MDCISETVEENHFVIKVITMDEDWDGLIPEDRAGSKVQYSIAGQTRAVSGCIMLCVHNAACMCVVLDYVCVCDEWGQLAPTCAPHTMEALCVCACLVL